MTAEQEYDQPPGISEQDHGVLPPSSEAATRVLTYVSWFGDGIVNHEYDSNTPYGEADPHFGPPLFARDLESVAKAAQTSGGAEDRGGNLGSAARTAPNPRPGLVIVATHRGGDPMVVGGLAPNVVAQQGHLDAWSDRSGFTDVHFALERVTYERMTLAQAEGMRS